MTGATGYIGARVCSEFTHRQISTRALVRRQVPWLRVEDQFVDDLTSPRALETALAGIESIVHLAGSNEVTAAERPDEAIEDTVAATRRLVAAAESAGVGRFVYVSTVHVYGEALVPGAQITEETLPRPRSVYGIARLGAEQFVQASAGEMDVVILRLTNAVGAPAHPTVDRWSLVGNDLCRQAIIDGELRLRSSGLQWRDFVSMTDVLCLLRKSVTDELPAGLYNAGSGACLTIRALAELIQDAAYDLLGSRPPLSTASATPPATVPYVVRVDKLGASGYRFSADIREAIDETMRFCLEHRSELRI